MKLKNFITEEFVSPEAYAIHGNKSIEMMDKDLLLFIENFHPFCAKHFGGKVSIIINDWKWGGKFLQRGLRTFDYYLDKLTSEMGCTPSAKQASEYYEKSRSQHKFGRGLDFDVYVHQTRIDPAIIRQLIIDNRHLFWIDAISFIEDGVNWVHVDTRATDNFLTVWHVSTGNVVTYN